MVAAMCAHTGTCLFLICVLLPAIFIFEVALTFHRLVPPHQNEKLVIATVTKTFSFKCIKIVLNHLDETSTKSRPPSLND